MSEETTRVAVLLEDIQTQVRGIAEAHVSLSQRIDRMEGRFEARFDSLETRFDVLTLRVGGLEKRLDGFARDTRGRLKRIETHLELNGSHPRPRSAQAASSRRRKRP